MKKLLSSLLLSLTVIVTAAPAYADCYNYVSHDGTLTQSSTPSPTNPVYPEFYTQGNIILRKIDDTYYDSYDATTGDITRKVGVLTLDGTEQVARWNHSSGAENYTAYEVRNVMQDGGLDGGFSSHFEFKYFNQPDIMQNGVYIQPSYGRAIFSIANTIVQNADMFKAWLAEQAHNGTPVVVYYGLAEPVTEHVGTQWCEGIKIATTAYNDAQFAPVEEALENAVTTIKDVVANTIVQADAIQNLQDTKQTMPDANGTNGTCPRFRQCLLVETEDGAPQWFQIADPYRDLITPMAQNKTQSNIGTVSNYASGRGFAANGKNDPKSQYYNGDVALRQATDNTTSVSVRQFSDANLSGGQYKNLTNREWAVTWDGDEMTGNSGDFLPGVIYGESKCTSVGGTKNYVYDYPTLLSSLTNEQQTEWATEWSASTASNYAQCWCKMTAVGLDGAITPVGSAAPWVFYYTYASAGICAQYCAANCADGIRGYSAFRSSVLGFAL